MTSEQPEPELPPRATRTPIAAWDWLRAGQRAIRRDRRHRGCGRRPHIVPGRPRGRHARPPSVSAPTSGPGPGQSVDSSTVEAEGRGQRWPGVENVRHPLPPRSSGAQSWTWFRPPSDTDAGEERSEAVIAAGEDRPPGGLRGTHERRVRKLAVFEHALPLCLPQEEHRRVGTSSGRSPSGSGASRNLGEDSHRLRRGGRPAQEIAWEPLTVEGSWPRSAPPRGEFDASRTREL